MPATASPTPSPSCPVCEIHAESVFRVDGMDCHEEVALIERRLKGLTGVERLRADVINARLTVTFDAARTSASAIVEAVSETGMRAWLEHEAPTRVADTADRAKRRLLVVSGIAIAAGWGFGWLALPIPEAVSFGLGVGTGGWFWSRRAWQSVRARSLDINALMLLAVSGAVVIGEWPEAATVAFLFGLAQWLESHTMERARLAIRALMDLAPAEALVRRQGRDVRVGVDDVTIGDRLIVRPGEKIALDGRVVAGTSDVNQSPITGESMPAAKEPGAEVFAGTINGHGALEVEVTRLRRDTTLARIISLVEHAQAERAPSQTFVERFARVYTPVVVALAAVIAVVPPLVTDDGFGPWVYRALVLLVISCPCALVISTPVAVVSALAAAARRGVLIKGGRHLETLGRVSCVAFDKTGTLTTGTPDVRSVAPLAEASVRDVLAVAAALEARSSHPVARAILARARHEGLSVDAAREHEALPGLGVSGVVDGQPALLGSRRLFESRGLYGPDVDAEVRRLAGGGNSPVLVAHGGRTIGVIAVADVPREAARAAVDFIRQGGVAHVVMLSGDQDSTARAIGVELGMTEVRAELLPEHKVDAVQALKRAHGVVAMVGDGVNDAPALAAADVGLAMGTAASDAALETADVALLADDLLRIPFAMRLGRATVRNIRVNIAVSLGLKAAVLILAAFGTATLWLAVMADMGASLLVIGNGLRLLRYE